ncbi:MAG: hypothetical protein H7334_04730, partial [Ferruginibacter sp.]|nr:hypothetical protein [Ferruginibacter sp.]
MKKIFTLTIVILTCINNYAQIMRATIGVGSQSNRIKIYLKSDMSQSPSTISTLQFNIGIKTSSVTTVPTMTMVSSTFPAVTWTIGAAINEQGYWNYNIYNGATLTPTFTAGVEFEAMELQFSNGAPNLGDVALVTLPDGGATAPNYSLFFCNGTVKSDGLSNLYYSNPSSGVVVDNKFSYDQTSTTNPGTSISSATISSIILPVKFLSFTAAKKDNSAILNWQIEDESALTDHYEVERSLTGTGFESA